MGEKTQQQETEDKLYPLKSNLKDISEMTGAIFLCPALVSVGANRDYNQPCTRGSNRRGN